MQTAASAAAHPRAHKFESSSAAFKKYLFIVISEDTGMKSSLLGLSLSSVDSKSKFKVKIPAELRRLADDGGGGCFL